MKNKTNAPKILRKYKINTSAIITLGIASIVLLIVYCFLSYFENNFSIPTMLQAQSENTSDSLKILNIINTVNNFLLVILSMVVSSFLSALLIDTTSKNNIVSDLLINDVFSNCDFYSILGKEQKQKVLKSLEKELYFSEKPIFHDMYSSIRETMNEQIHDNIYLENCSISIKCKILDKYIEKEVSKTIGIKSYNKFFRLSEFPIVSRAYSESVPCKPMDIDKLIINGELINTNDIILKGVTEETPLEAKNGYTTVNQFVYSKNIDVNNEKETKIEIRYRTRVPLNDKTYTYRLPHACKSLVFDFSLSGEESHNSYRLNTVAFGFIDDAKNTPNISNDKLSTKITFNNWIFPNDGVTVTICENF